MHFTTHLQHVLQQIAVQCVRVLMRLFWYIFSENHALK